MFAFKAMLKEKIEITFEQYELSIKPLFALNLDSAIYELLAESGKSITTWKETAIKTKDSIHFRNPKQCEKNLL